jgi:hypothetical protein
MQVVTAVVDRQTKLQREESTAEFGCHRGLKCRAGNVSIYIGWRNSLWSFFLRGLKNADMGCFGDEHHGDSQQRWQWNGTSDEH